MTIDGKVGPMNVRARRWSPARLLVLLVFPLLVTIGALLFVNRSPFSPFGPFPYPDVSIVCNASPWQNTLHPEQADSATSAAGLFDFSSSCNTAAHKQTWGASITWAVLMVGYSGGVALFSRRRGGRTKPSADRKFQRI